MGMKKHSHICLWKGTLARPLWRTGQYGNVCQNSKRIYTPGPAMQLLEIHHVQNDVYTRLLIAVGFGKD